MAESGEPNNLRIAGKFCRCLLEPGLLIEATIRQRPDWLLNIEMITLWPVRNKAYP
jgi:hypothetical protein